MLVGAYIRCTGISRQFKEQILKQVRRWPPALAKQLGNFHKLQGQNLAWTVLDVLRSLYSGCRVHMTSRGAPLRRHCLGSGDILNPRWGCARLGCTLNSKPQTPNPEAGAALAARPRETAEPDTAVHFDTHHYLCSGGVAVHFEIHLYLFRQLS